MGRWHYDEHGWLQAEGLESIESINEAIRFHHADCDTYEARIAELEAKLDWAQQIVKAQAETSNGTACAEERAAGNGGCGACSWCCSQWRERAEVATAELARVKAESLRVVECECQDMNRASDWYMTPMGLGWLGYKKDDREIVKTPDGYYEFRDCKKVRLERWETEE